MNQQNKKSDYDFLTESIVNISKAGAYDIVSKQVGELKEMIRELLKEGELEELDFIEPEENEKWQAIVKRAKLLSL